MPPRPPALKTPCPAPSLADSCKALGQLNHSSSHTIRSLFHNTANSSLITVSLHARDAYTRLHCRSIPCRWVVVAMRPGPSAVHHACCHELLTRGTQHSQSAALHTCRVADAAMPAVMPAWSGLDMLRSKCFHLLPPNVPGSWLSQLDLTPAAIPCTFPPSTCPQPAPLQPCAPALPAASCARRQALPQAPLSSLRTYSSTLASWNLRMTTASRWCSTR